MMIPVISILRYRYLGTHRLRVEQTFSEWLTSRPDTRCDGYCGFQGSGSARLCLQDEEAHAAAMRQECYSQQ